MDVCIEVEFTTKGMFPIILTITTAELPEVPRDPWVEKLIMLFTIWQETRDINNEVSQPARIICDRAGFISVG